MFVFIGYLHFLTIVESGWICLFFNQFIKNIELSYVFYTKKITKNINKMLLNCFRITKNLLNIKKIKMRDIK